MKKQLFGRAATLLTAITLLFSLIIVPAGADVTDAGGRAAVRDINVSSRIYELLFGTEEELRLCPGGSVFGVRIHGVGVYVEDVSSGIHTIKRGDRITGIAGQTVKSGDEIKRLISKSRGGSVRVTYLRGYEEEELTVETLLSDDGVPSSADISYGGTAAVSAAITDFTYQK